MADSSLLLICATAFAATMLLLAALAGVLRGLIELFPEKPATDSAAFVAISTVVSTMIPGATVSRIEEIDRT